MAPIGTELVALAGPNIRVGIDGLIPGSNPICVARHSFSNWFTVKANFSFTNSL